MPVPRGTVVEPVEIEIAILVVAVCVCSCAEKKALLLIAEALKDKPELLTYQYITKLAPNVQAMFLPSNAPFLFPLPEMQPSVTNPQ